MPKFWARLVYRVSSRIARTSQRNPVLKNQKDNSNNDDDDNDNNNVEIKEDVVAKEILKP